MGAAPTSNAVHHSHTPVRRAQLVQAIYMMVTRLTLALIAVLTYANARHCPLPVVPHLPLSPLSVPELSALQQNLTSTLNDRLHQAATNAEYANLSVSVSVADGCGPIFAYGFGPPDKNVTSDGVYNIASISKVFTVYEAILNGLQLDDLVANYVPEFRKDPYNQITLRALAGYVSGLTRDYPENDLSRPGGEYAPLASVVLGGVPALPLANPPPCEPASIAKSIGLRTCTAKDYVELLSSRPLLYEPNSFVSYSNVAVDLLGYIVSLQTKADFTTLIARDINQALGLSHTFAEAPDESVGVIATSNANTTWHQSWGPDLPAGGLFSSATDLTRFTSGILNGLIPSCEDGPKLPLSGSQIRDWLAPHAYIPTTNQLVGLPWIEARRTDPQLNGGYAWTVSYKGGTNPGYGTYVAVVPEYGFGVAVLVSTVDTDVRAPIVDTVVDTVAHFREISRVRQAKQIYAGTYTAGSGNDSSVLQLDVADDGLGLIVRKWIYYGADMAKRAILARSGSVTPDQEIRLYPSKAPNEWRWTSNSLDKPPTGSIFDGSCEAWDETDSVYYGGQPVDLMRMASNGATPIAAVEIPWLNQTLKRKTM